MSAESRHPNPFLLPKNALLDVCRQALSNRGRCRFWELGPKSPRPRWFRKGSPDLFCDAEVLHRERGTSIIPQAMRLTALSWVDGQTRQLRLSFRRVRLYRANYQLFAVEVDGAPARVLESQG